MFKKVYKLRLICIFFCFFSLFSFLLWRLVQIQYYNASELSVIQNKEFSYTENINDLDYMLLDRNGKQLLEYYDKYYAVIDPYIFQTYNDSTDLAELYTLKYILINYNNTYDLTKDVIASKDIKLYYQIDENAFNKIKILKDIKGLYAYKSSLVSRENTYSIENMISSIKKTDGSGLKSVNSLEGTINSTVKSNKNVQTVFNRDVNGTITQGKTIIPDNNINVKLTLDKNIQDNIEQILNGEKYNKYKQIGVILMESDTGKILGFAQKNNLMPNINIGATYAGFYPGSTFKIIVEEAGFINNLLNVNDMFTCKGNFETPDDRLHGTLTPENALVVSCNDIFIQIGRKVGFDNIMKNAKLQNLLMKILNLDSEIQGSYDGTKLDQGGNSLLSYGQNIRITPIEAMGIVNTVINKGIYVDPQIVDSYITSDGKTLQSFTTKSKNIFDENIATIMKNQMIKVVASGTGKKALIPTVETGGKTGTSQRGNTNDGWFIGFFKLNDKYYSMVIYVQDIDKQDSGGVTSAPIFKDIVTMASKYINN
jgi:cell division protein FtsI/penicillin-binding protein 2